MNLPKCPVEVTLMLIGSKWNVLIIRELLSGRKRFSELKRAITGISPKVLTSQLRDMEKKGLLTRNVYPEIPPKVEYQLTDLGYTLKDILDALQLWGEEYQRLMNATADI